MSSNAQSAKAGASAEQPQPTYFQSQRAMLVSEIAQSLDSVLTNLNRLNRSLEAVIAVGNEFSSVEALWSRFEDVMGDQQKNTTGAERVDRSTSDEAQALQDEYGT